MYVWLHRVNACKGMQCVYGKAKERKEGKTKEMRGRKSPKQLTRHCSSLWNHGFLRQQKWIHLSDKVHIRATLKLHVGLNASIFGCVRLLCCDTEKLQTCSSGSEVCFPPCQAHWEAGMNDCRLKISKKRFYTLMRSWERSKGSPGSRGHNPELAVIFLGCLVCPWSRLLQIICLTRRAKHSAGKLPPDGSVWKNPSRF